MKEGLGDNENFGACVLTRAGRVTHYVKDSDGHFVSNCVVTTIQKSKIQFLPVS